MYRNLEELRGVIKGKIEVNEPLKNHTSFHIGGAASIYVEPKDTEDLKKLLLFIRKKSLPFFILGGGSNVLVKDQGFDGIVIGSKNFNFFQVKGNKATAGSGLKLPFFLGLLAKEGLAGMEFFAGIPGTVGGAVLMNAGSQKEGIGNFIEKVEAMDFSGRVKNIYKTLLNFSYRNSNLTPYFFLLSVEFRLKNDQPKIIKERTEKALRKKRESQPIKAYSAGCIFKNPDGASAGKLIEEAGLKGKRKGDAFISEKHSNFIINSGKASASDVLFLMKKIQGKVYQKFKIRLEPEIKII